MTDEDDDRDLLSLYRAQAHEMPAATLDARILAAARGAGKRRQLLLLLPAMAAAAVLVLIFRPPRHESQAPAVSPAIMAQAGLYDGQVAQQLADPQLMRQLAIRQLPGGSDEGKSNGL